MNLAIRHTPPNPWPVLFVFGAALIVVRLIAGCSPSELPSAAAAAGYEAQQMACIDTYGTKAAIDACRAKVKADWATDAGKDARE